MGADQSVLSLAIMMVVNPGIIVWRIYGVYTDRSLEDDQKMLWYSFYAILLIFSAVIGNIAFSVIRQIGG